MFGMTAGGHLNHVDPAKSDHDLLRHYLHTRSPSAFSEIVHRHVDLVYGVALRRLCGNATMARDVAQAVFTTLALKPPRLSGSAALAGWLYTTTRFTVSHTVRAERRRQERERKAEAVNAILNQPDPGACPPIPPEMLDRILDRLDATDRAVLILRFFEARSFLAIGQSLGASEDAARMRVNRAIERLRGHFAANGIVTSAAAISAALGAEAMAAPAGLAAGISSAALAQAGALSAVAAPNFGFFSMTAKFALTVVAAVAAGYAIHEYRQANAAAQEIAALTAERDHLRAEVAVAHSQAAASSRESADAKAQASAFQAELARLRLKSAAGRRSLTPEDSNQRNKALAKAAQMKALLEAGMPIKGVAVVLVGGEAVDRPLALVMGTETRIDTDEGIYAVLPSVRADGMVRYALRLLQNDSSQGHQVVVSTPVVIDWPWGTWEVTNLAKSGVTAFAFVPDDLGP